MAASSRRSRQPVLVSPCVYPESHGVGASRGAGPQAARRSREAPSRRASLRRPGRRHWMGAYRVRPRPTANLPASIRGPRKGVG